MLMAIAVILVVAEWQFEQATLMDTRAMQRQETDRLAQDLRTRMIARVSQDIYLLYGLRAFIELNPDVSQDDYAKYAASIKRSRPSIKNIAAAPDLVIKYVYPYDENKAVLGLDYRKAPQDQRNAVFRSVREGKVVIAGPVALIQGGKAIILRLPVYVPTPAGDVRLWGLLAALVDIDALYDELGLDELASDFDLAIRGEDGLGIKGDVFYGDEGLFQDNANSVQYEIPLENGSWVLAVRPKGGWVSSYSGQNTMRAAFVILFVVLGGFGLFAIGYLKERLEARRQRLQVFREKTEFMEILSHEIRSPLQGVLAAQRYVLDSGIEEPLRSVVEIAEQSGDYIISLINDYLDLQRAQSNTLNICNSLVDIQQVLHEIISIVTTGKKEQVASLQLKIDDNVPAYLMLDEKKIKQILVNIISNAVKYTAKGYIRIFVSYDERDAKPHLNVRVEDTGIGIEDQELATLFDRFTRSEGGESRSGSGLGLAIAKMLLDVLGGTIEVESILGEGSVFTLAIPARPGGNEDQPIARPEAKAVGENTERLKHLRVLVADDVLVNRILLDAMLSPLVGSVTMVADGQQVLDAVEKTAFDIIIMDIQMPVMNGAEVARKIRKSPKFRHIPIIGLTGEDVSGVLSIRAFEGMDKLLNKPINLESLLKEMIDVLEIET